MKYIVKFFVVTFFLLISTYTLAEEKIAVLDMTYALNESKAGKGAQEFLTKTFNDDLKKFADIEKSLKKEEQDLLAQKNVLSKEEFENKLKDLRNDISNYQKDRNKSSNEIKKSRVNASTKLISKLTPILEEYSKKNSIRIIVQKKNIVMGKKEDDITKDILELINQKVKSIKID